MMPPGLGPVELAIQHVRNHGERGPIDIHVVGKCPGDSFQAQATENCRVVSNVNSVIVTHKLVMQRLPEDGKGDCRRKTQMPGTVQRSCKPAGGLAGSGNRESGASGTSTAGETGALKLTPSAFAGLALIFNLRLTGLNTCLRKPARRDE